VFERERKLLCKLTKKPFVSARWPAVSRAASPAPLTANAQSITSVEAQQIATDAYVYGYSLITTEVTRVQMSNVPNGWGFKRPPGNSSTFHAIRRPTIAAFSAECGQRCNSVTLARSERTAGLQPSRHGKPLLSIRDYDLWMPDSESSPSKRTADGKLPTYLFTGPGWKGGCRQA